MEYFATSSRRRWLLVGAARKTVSRPAWRIDVNVRLGLFHAQVGEQAAVDAACGGIARQRFQAVAQHRIHIGEQQQRDFGALADLRGDIEHGGELRAGLQRAIAAALDHRAVGDGIGEGNAQLDQIRAAAFERRDEFRRCGRAMDRRP